MAWAYNIMTERERIFIEDGKELSLTSPPVALADSQYPSKYP